jgi:hypothetical protein
MKIRGQVYDQATLPNKSIPFCPMDSLLPLFGITLRQTTQVTNKLIARNAIRNSVYCFVRRYEDFQKVLSDEITSEN